VCAEPLDHEVETVTKRLSRRTIGRMAAIMVVTAGVSSLSYSNADTKHKKKKRKRKKGSGSGVTPAPPRPVTPKPPPAATYWPRVYEGSAEFKVQLVGLGGGIQTYRTNVRINVDAHHASETNPFRFTMQSRPLTNQAGEITIISGYVYNRAWMQFWNYAFDPTKAGYFEGTLTDDHLAQALGLNAMMVPYEIYPGYVTPYLVAIRKGAQMAGQFLDNQLAVAVAGNSSYGIHPFQFGILANRVA
jgi:hypothetical protein